MACLLGFHSAYSSGLELAWVMGWPCLLGLGLVYR